MLSFTINAQLYNYRSHLQLTLSFIINAQLYNWRSALKLTLSFTSVAQLYKCRSALQLTLSFIIDIFEQKISSEYCRSLDIQPFKIQLLHLAEILIKNIAKRYFEFKPY